MNRHAHRPESSALPPANLAGDRRAFLRALVRYPLAAGVAAFGGWLALRRIDPDAGQPCLKQRVCRGCQLFTGCDRPQAVATRQHT